VPERDTRPLMSSYDAASAASILRAGTPVLRAGSRMLALGLQWVAEGRKQLCLSQPFRQRGEPARLGSWLAAVPAAKRGICARFRAEESELTYRFRRMVQELSTSAGYGVR
jgi:hypothetical protein